MRAARWPNHARAARRAAAKPTPPLSLHSHPTQEFLHIDFTKRVITAVAVILAAHAQAPLPAEATGVAAAGAMAGRVAAANADRAATLDIAAAKHVHTGQGCCP
jgi:hypothetical protein